MPTCPSCDADLPEDGRTCPECGTGVGDGGPATGAGGTSVDPAEPPVRGADYDPEAERERFEQRYGIDVGDRTVDEFLDHLERQDYSLTPWLWVLVAGEAVGVTLFGLAVWGDVALVVGRPAVFTAVSVTMAVAILLDTREVGQFRPRAKIRWAYVLLAAVPLVGHITGAYYLVLRRLLHERTVEHRRRLVDSGFDLDVVED